MLRRQETVLNQIPWMPVTAAALLLSCSVALAQSAKEIELARQIDSPLTDCILRDDTMNPDEKMFWIQNMKKVETDGNLEELRDICFSALRKQGKAPIEDTSPGAIHSSSMPLAAKKAIAKEIETIFTDCSKGDEWVMGIAINPETGAAVFTWDRPSRPGEDERMVWFHLDDVAEDGFYLNDIGDERRLTLIAKSGRSFIIHWKHWTPDEGIKDDWYADHSQSMVFCPATKAGELVELLKTLKSESPPNPNADLYQD